MEINYFFNFKDFEGVEVPDIPDVKSEYDKIYDQYFRVTADHMPPDPVVEAQRAEEAEVKKEIEEAEKARVKGTFGFLSVTIWMKNYLKTSFFVDLVFRKLLSVFLEVFVAPNFSL